MTTTIISNGSKFAGEPLDSLDTLLDVLKRETLDPCFERYGNFVETLRAGVTRFHGNFRTFSHVFSIHTDEPDVIAILTDAIRANQRTDAYRAARKGMKLPRKARAGSAKQV